MGTLTVRDLDDAVKAQLRVRAARHGRSMEAEVRAILRDVVRGDESAGTPGADRVGGVRIAQPATRRGGFAGLPRVRIDGDSLAMLDELREDR